MAKTLTKTAAVPSTLIVTGFNGRGQRVTVSGAGPWSNVSDSDAAILEQARVNVAGSLLKPFQ